MKFRRSRNSKPIPVLLDEALRERIEAISQKMGEPKSTVMRIAMRIGLDGLLKAFESAKERSAASIAFPEHKPSSEALNEGNENSPNPSNSPKTVDYPALKTPPVRAQKFPLKTEKDPKRK